MQFGQRTDVGCVRTTNEDAMAIIQTYDDFAIAIVADGMGGHQAGEVASDIAIAVLCEELTDKRTMVPAVLRKSIQKANEQIYKEGTTNKAHFNMGTTLVLTAMDEHEALVANVGDSRAYHFSDREKELSQITKDHSLVEQLLQTGELKKEEAKTFPLRNVITRTLGIDQTVAVDFFEISWQENDIFLLCSDGLTNQVEDEMIAAVLQKNDSMQSLCDELVTMAKEAGGHDNITVVLAKNASKGG